jgi:hypothetical protein
MHTVKYPVEEVAQIFSKIPGGQCQGVSYFGFYFYCNFINKLFEMFAVGGGEGGGGGGGFVIHPCVHLLSLT